MGKVIIVGLLIMCVVWSCSFGAVAGYRSGGERRDVHVLSENSFHLFSDNHMLSENKLNSDNSGDGGMGMLLIAGVCVLFVWALGGKKGGGHE